MGKDDAETTNLKKELEDLINKCKVGRRRIYQKLEK